MLNLIRKDLLLYMIVTIPSQVILSLVWLLTFRELHVVVVLVQILFVFFVVIVITSHSEQVEEINNGYQFLRNLPVTTFEIVGAKFILILSTITFLGFLNILLFAFFQGEPQDLKISISALVLTCCGALLISALVSIGIFFLGGENFIKVGSVGIMVIALTITIYMKGIKLDADVAANDVLKFIDKANLLFYIMLTLILYSGLMFLAILIRKYGKFGWIGN